jgi:WD40 repeat protein
MMTGEEICTLIGHKRDVINASFSPDESRVLTTGQDNQLKVWDLQGHELLTLSAESTIYHAVWSPDGSTVLAGLGDGTVRLWRAATWSALQQVGSGDAPLETRIAEWRNR